MSPSGCSISSSGSQLWVLLAVLWAGENSGAPGRGGALHHRQAVEAPIAVCSPHHEQLVSELVCVLGACDQHQCACSFRRKLRTSAFRPSENPLLSPSPTRVSAASMFRCGMPEPLWNSPSMAVANMNMRTGSGQQAGPWAGRATYIARWPNEWEGTRAGRRIHTSALPLPFPHPTSGPVGRQKAS